MTSANLLNDLALLDEVVALLEVNDRVVPITTIGREIFRFRNPHIGYLRQILNGLLKEDPRLVVRQDDYLELLPDQREFGSLDESDYVVIDVETTGTNPQMDHMTEIAAIRVSRRSNGSSGKFIGEEFATLVHPGRDIPPSVTRLTGITNEMVARAPRFDDIADELITFIGNSIVVAHNAYFDLNFLNSAIGRAYDKRLANLRLCTLKLSRRLFPELSNHKLHTVADYLGIEIEDRHRASGDARATAKIFLRMLDMLEDRGVMTIFEAREFQKRRKGSAPARIRRARL